MFELKKIHFLSALKVSAALGATVGVAALAIYFVIFSFNNYGYYGANELVFVPLIILAISGGTLVALSAIVVPIYNLIAEHFGGVEIDLARIDTTQ